MNRLINFFNSDFYQYNESSVYLENKMENDIANFDVFYRGSCPFTIVAGIDEVIYMIEEFINTDSNTKRNFLKNLIYDEKLIDYLSETPFSIDIKGFRNGDIVFPNEPILSIKGPIIQARILETPILNILQYYLECAKEISEIKRVVNSKKLLYFGIRRSAGLSASLVSSRVTRMFGFDGFSSILYGHEINEKSSGTMSHAYVQSFGTSKENELKAFDLFIKNNKYGYPNILLIDTYDSIGRGIENAIRAFKNNIEKIKTGIYGIRIDSGNIEDIVIKCREKLDNAEFKDAIIVVSGGLNSFKIAEFEKKYIPIDIYGIGDSIAKYNDRYGEINLVYKLSEYNGEKLLKISNDPKKRTLAGEKAVVRVFFDDDFIDIMFTGEDSINIDFDLNENREIYKFINKELLNNGINKEILKIQMISNHYMKNGIIIEKNKKILELEKSSIYFNEFTLPYLKKYLDKEIKLKNSKVFISKKLAKINNELINKLNITM